MTATIRQIVAGLADSIFKSRSVTVNADDWSLSVHDGATLGGIRTARANSVVPSLNPKGAIDRSSDFTAASLAAGNNGAFVLASGNYTLSAAPSFTAAGVFSAGGQFSGAGIPGIADDSIRASSSFWMGRQTSGQGNQFTLSAHMVGLDGGSHTASFERDVFATSLNVYDNSTYSADGNLTTPGVATSARDYVGYGSHVYVGPGLGRTRTRTWGANMQTVIGAAGQEGTADGAMASIEMRCDNYGTDSPAFETATTKVLAPLFAAGTRLITAGSFFGLGGAASDGCGGYYGYAVDGAAVRNHAFAVVQINGVDPQNALWGVTPTGAMALKSQSQPATDSGRAQLYFDGANLKMVLPNGTVKTFTAA